MSTTTTIARGADRGMLLIALAAVLWGTVGVSTGTLYVISHTNPLSVGFFRLGLAVPALLAASLALLGRRAYRMRPRTLGLSALIGGLLALYQAAFFTAIGHAGVTLSTLVTLCTAPLFVALLSVLFTRERPGATFALALLGALTGTVLLVGLTPGAELPHGALLGILFALASGLGYAGVAVAGRLVADDAHPLQVNTVAFATGALLLLLLALPTGFATDYPPLGWGLLLYLGLVPTALGYALFLRGMRATPPTVASLITLLEPLTATLLAWWLFGERLGPQGLAGALLLLGSLALLSRRRP